MVLVFQREQLVQHLDQGHVNAQSGGIPGGRSPSRRLPAPATHQGPLGIESSDQAPQVVDITRSEKSIPRESAWATRSRWASTIAFA